MKKFRVRITQLVTVQFDDDRATENSAAHAAKTYCQCDVKEGYPKNMMGKCLVLAETPCEASEVVELSLTASKPRR